MKDIPMFTTEYGVASLALREIPYRGAAYIRPLCDDAPRDLLDECAAFCRMCGATDIYACGQAAAAHFPLHAEILCLRLTVYAQAVSPLLCPVTAQTVSRWRELCNRRMASVDHAATLTAADEPTLLCGGTYFVRDGQQLLGLGRLADGELRTLAGIVPGAGRRVLDALVSAAEGQTLHLSVASTNRRALALYEAYGFTCVGRTAQWYHITGG